jgi:aspartate carbamoyltransferase catalytic subunit
VARSNAWALTALGAEVIFCGPPTLLPITCPWPVEAVEVNLEIVDRQQFSNLILKESDKVEVISFVGGGV